jgi:phosphatidylserine decarboxylase
MALPEIVERWLSAVVSGPALSRLTGRLADLRLPKAVLVPAIRAYVRTFGVDLGEAEGPIDAYPNFNAFFTRRLRAGARPVDSAAGAIVSPSDSRLTSIGTVPPDGRLEQIKGRTYALEALLGSPEDAAAFRTGSHATLYLSPGMYHRVHVPADGRITGWRHVPGRHFPVNPRAVRSVPGLFVRNERVAVFIDSEAHGRVAVVLVGAANVSRLSLAFADVATNPAGTVSGRGGAFSRGGTASTVTPIPVRRGHELGAFNLGSTVVLLVADPALRPAPGVEPGAVVRMGQALWRST